MDTRKLILGALAMFAAAAPITHSLLGGPASAADVRSTGAVQIRDARSAAAYCQKPSRSADPIDIKVRGARVGMQNGISASDMAYGLMLRCEAGAPLVCGVSDMHGVTCAKRDRRRQAEHPQFCRDYPNEESIPFSAGNRLSVFEWRCRGITPVITRRLIPESALDAAGYAKSEWRPVVGAAPASSDSQYALEAKRFLTETYRRYASVTNSEMQTYMTPSLRKVVDAALSRNDLSHDLICQCQDGAKLRAFVTIVSANDTTAQASVGLQMAWETQPSPAVSLVLQRENGRWLIDDIIANGESARKTYAGDRAPTGNERAAILDAVRPWAQRQQRADFQFVVTEFRTVDNWALVSVELVRQNGTPIKVFWHGDMVTDYATALLRKTGNRWRVVEYYHRPSDVAWCDYPGVPKSLTAC